MRRARAGVLLAVVAGGSTACGGGDGGAVHAADAIVVQLSAGAAAPAAMREVFSGAPIVPLASIGEDGDAPLLRVPLQPGADPVAAAENAGHQPGVEFAEPVYIYRSHRVPDDPRLRDLWGLTGMNVPAVWDKTTGDRRIPVAIIDDGVAFDHPDLRPNRWTNPHESDGSGDDDGDGYAGDVHGWDFVDSDADPSPATSGEERWHGSHVAGTIGAAGDNHLGVVGMNWKVSLMAIRAIGPRGGRSDDLARAIDYAVDHGARVINASWGGSGTSEVLTRAIQRAARRGVLFVAAAGNDSAAKPSFPAALALDNLISVGAATPQDALAPFSNRGALVAAPGVGILSTTAPGSYERYDGTSMAAPHVSGLAALLWARRPDATLADVRSAILASAAAMKGTRYGAVDAAKALGHLDGSTTPGNSGLSLSRADLTFALRPGRVPRAQIVALRSAGGGSQAWTATASHPWIVLPRDRGETPARVTIRVNQAALARGENAGKVVFRDASGAGPTLSVRVETGNAGVGVAGEGCSWRDSVLRVVTGSGCTLRGASADAPSVRWTLPGGAEVSGARLDAQFLRPGEYRLFVARDEGTVDSIPVVVE